MSPGANATAYRRGGYYEVQVADLMRAEGYWVQQVRGSKGPADLIALKPGQVVLAQVKSGTAEMSHAGWNGLLRLAGDVRAVPVLVTCQPRIAPVFQRITGAHVSNKQLWPAEPFLLDELAALPPATSPHDMQAAMQPAMQPAMHRASR